MVYQATTLLNVFCSVPQNKTYQSVNLGRIISQSADNLPDSASCILKSSHAEESQGTQPSQPGGGDSSTTDHRWNGICSLSSAPLHHWNRGWAVLDRLLNPRITAATPASATLLHHPPAVSSSSHFPLGEPTSPFLVPHYERARPIRITEVQEAEMHHLCFTVKG